MIECEIIKAVEAETQGLVRYDVQVTAAGLYREVVSFTCPMERTPDEINRQQAAARAFALEQFVRSVGSILGGMLGAGVPAPQAPQRAPQATAQPQDNGTDEEAAQDHADKPRRRRRTRAEIEADRAKEAKEAAEAGIHSPPPDTSIPPSETAVKIQQEQEAADQSRSIPPSGIDIAAEVANAKADQLAAGPKVGGQWEIFTNSTEHELRVSAMVRDDYGKGWSQSPEILAAVREFCAEACRITLPAWDKDGSASPQLRALYGQFVRSKCPQ